MPKKPRKTIEYGDFQTPLSLAEAVCRLLSSQGIRPASVIEPTCGVGAFLLASLDQFPSVSKALGIDINRSYVEQLNQTLQRRLYKQKVDVVEGDFFNTDWASLLHLYPDPLLVVGNPPWVTNSELGTLGSTNLPEKSNFQKFNGFDALTGKSNFDISEWMLLNILQWLNGRAATMAMLCKTVVARKVLAYAWKNHIELETAHIYKIDAGNHFSAAVDACLLMCHLMPRGQNQEARVHDDLDDSHLVSTIGYREGELVANTKLFERWKHLRNGESIYKWRSGVKHDCSKVMELRKEGKLFRNGLGELVELEDDYLYPMLKSSDLAKGLTEKPVRWMIVTQKTIGEDTSIICHNAPKTWRYLERHAQLLNRRSSSIYKNRPPFSVFGVGDYTFAPWKIAISGFYKSLKFNMVKSIDDKPIVLDDTSYFIPCYSWREMQFLVFLLNSQISHEFYKAFIFWDTKRPITIDLLRRLDLSSLAREFGKYEDLQKHVNSLKSSDKMHCTADHTEQLVLPEI